MLDAEKDIDSPPAFVYRDREGDSVSDVLAGLRDGLRFIGGGERFHAD